jgi:hypothetical protein
LVFHPTLEFQAPGLVPRSRSETHSLDPAMCPYFILHLHL